MKRFLAFVCLLIVAGTANAGATYLGAIPAGSTSVTLHFALWDYSNPNICPASPITHTTNDLTFYVFDNAVAASGFTDTFTETDSTLEDIATIRTYATPTATKARFEQVSGCAYELQLPDSAFASVTGKTQLFIVVTDGATNAVVDWLFWIDLTPVALETLVAATWEEDITAYNTAGTAGQQLNDVLDSIETAVGTTLDNKIDLANASLSSLEDNQSLTPLTTVASVTSQTILVADTGPTTASAHVGRPLCARDATVPENEDCKVITAYDQSTFTYTIAAGMNFTVAAGDILWVPSDTYLISIASAAITATAIATDAIGAAEIATDAITATELAADSITGSEIGSGAIAAAEIAADAIGASELATDAIGAAEIAADAITTAELASDSITSTELATDAIGAAEVAADALASSELATTAVTEIQTGLATSVEVGAVPTAAENVAAMFAEIIGTYDGEPVDLACALVIQIADAVGEMDNTGAGPTLTFKTPDGVSDVAVVTMNGAGGDRTGSVINCP